MEFTNRQKMLLKNVNLCDLNKRDESYIRDCEMLSKVGQNFLVVDDESLKMIENYVEEYKYKSKEVCENLPKSNPPILDIIVGLPGSGKSKIIKNNPYMNNSFKADADVIKKELSMLLKCNINSTELHNISSYIRDLGIGIALENKCNIVVEKIGKSEKSIIDLIDRVGIEYDKNLWLIHCNTQISRLRNANRFLKYNDDSSGIVARMIPDSFIKDIGVKPIKTFFNIVYDEAKRKEFKVCEAFIQESLYEGNSNVKLVNLYSEEKDLDKRYEKVKNRIYDITQSSTLTNEVLEKIYSVDTVANVDRLIEIENGDFSKIADILKDVKNSYSKGEL